MDKINMGRVLLGGLVAGLILNIGEFLLNGKILAAQMEEFFRKCGVPPPGPGFIVTAVLITFVLGIVVVFVYAAIRTRFGAGPKTAIIGGLVAWFLVVVYGNIIGTALGFIPTNMLVIIIVWELVEYTLAAVAGAWVYKEG